jgi:hypothetical protein
MSGLGTYTDDLRLAVSGNPGYAHFMRRVVLRHEVHAAGRIVARNLYFAAGQQELIAGNEYSFILVLLDVQKPGNAPYSLILPPQI